MPKNKTEANNKMAYGMLDTTNISEKQFCLIEDLPEGTGLDRIHAANPSRGDKAAHLFPSDARVNMSKGWTSTKLADFVANTQSLLIVSPRTRKIIEKINKWPTEYIPVSIFNQKKKLASADYFIVNPLGTYDILDFKASDVDRDEKETVYAVYKMEFSPAKIKKGKIPDLFRPKGDTSRYVISKNIGTELRKLNPKVTNLHYVDLVEVTNGRSKNIS